MSVNDWVSNPQKGPFLRAECPKFQLIQMLLTRQNVTRSHLDLNLQPLGTWSEHFTTVLRGRWTYSQQYAKFL